MTRTRITALALALTAIAALPAAADVWVVTLVNDATFESRYQPIVDPNDEAKILMMTNAANWIALQRTALKSVVQQSETLGFGRVLDNATVELGFLRNDAPVPGEEGSGESNPTTELLRYFQQRDSAPPYTMEQFVEPEEATGIPVNWTRFTTPPIGGGR